MLIKEKWREDHHDHYDNHNHNSGDDNYHYHIRHIISNKQGHCGAQGAILVEIYRETGDMLGLGLNR